MPDIAALVTPPLLLDSTGKPANGEIFLTLSQDISVPGGIATPVTVKGLVTYGQFTALDGQALNVPVTPEGAGVHIFVELREDRPSGSGQVRAKYGIRRTVSVPDQASVTWDELIDVVPVDAGPDYVVPPWVATTFAASEAAEGYSAAAEVARVAAVAAQAATEAAVASVPTDAALSAKFERTGRLDAREFAVDKTTITGAVLTAAIDAADGKQVYLFGTIDLGTGYTYTGTKAVNLVGDPSLVTLTSTGSYVLRFTGATSNPVNIRGIKVAGAGTSASSSAFTQSAISVENRTGPVTIIENEVSGWVNAAGVRVQGGKDVVVSRNKFTNGFDTNPVKSTLGAVHITGVVEGVSIKDNVMTGPTTNPWSVGIMLVGFESLGYVVRDIVVSGNRVTGLIRAGIGVTHEDSLAVFNTGQLAITDNIIRNCKEQGIKVKVAKRVHVSGNFIEGCNTLPELAGELDGGINIQSSSETVVSGNTIVNDGTDGIRWDCKQTGSIAADGGNIGRANHTLSGNTIIGSTNDGIRIGQAVTDLAITGNTVVASGRHGISLTHGTATADLRIHRISITGNISRGCTTGSGINVVGDDVNMSGNIITKSGSYGIVFGGGSGFTLTGNTVLDSGQGGTGTIGIRVSGDALQTVITGNTSGNREGTTQTYGISLGAVAVVGLNFLDGNSTARIQTTTNARHQFLEGASTAKVNVTGSKADGTALTNLLSQLATLNLITNSTTA